MRSFLSFITEKALGKHFRHLADHFGACVGIILNIVGKRVKAALDRVAQQKIYFGNFLALRVVLKQKFTYLTLQAIYQDASAVV